MAKLWVLDLQLFVQETDENTLQELVAKLGGWEQGGAWDTVDVERNLTFEFADTTPLHRKAVVEAVNALPGAHGTAGWAGWYDDDTDEESNPLENYDDSGNVIHNAA
jgi:hypothetical protein